jgi:telomerase reverse transcriptase
VIGTPLGDLPLLSSPTKSNQQIQAPEHGPSIKKAGNSSAAVKSLTNKSPSRITFVRNRMFYARPALNAQGTICFGLRHIHVLNRYPIRRQEIEEQHPSGQCGQMREEAGSSTIHVMMYIFPRQFGLHNVFTSAVDSRETIQPLQDYTLREDEINRLFKSSEKKSGPFKPKLHKRLRGVAFSLIAKLQVSHARCAYKKLLDYYCPVQVGLV